MTLSRFLRDYLYIPLGGSRAGPWRTGTNLMITMLLGGLWHGASWSFALWGGLHGLFLIINRLWEHTALHDRLSNLAGLGRHAWKSACVVLTFNTVCLAWCFFRLTDVAQSVACLQKCLFFEVDKMFAGGAAVAPAACFLAGYGVVTLLASILTKGAALADVSRMIAPRPFLCGASWGGAVGLGTLALLLAPGGEKMPFIYFQF
jgi:alginate O-acetyltransferase complex protein AlgI